MFNPTKNKFEKYITTNPIVGELYVWDYDCIGYARWPADFRLILKDLVEIVTFPLLYIGYDIINIYGVYYKHNFIYKNKRCSLQLTTKRIESCKIYNWSEDLANMILKENGKL